MCVGVQCLYLRILRSYILVFGSWGVVGVYVYLEVSCCICVFVDLPGIVGPHGQFYVYHYLGAYWECVYMNSWRKVYLCIYGVGENLSSVFVFVGW